MTQSGNQGENNGSPQPSSDVEGAQETDAGLASLSELAEGGVSVVALGGLGEIGMNCTLFEYDEQILIVDCGVTFPDTNAFGVDLITPNFDYLFQNADRVVGLVLTHGHEDHIGAVPYLLRELNPPVFGLPLTLGMVARKLREHGLLEHAELVDVAVGERIEVGPFEVEPIHVNHSIPHAVALAIKTPAGLMVHTGDFKIDHTPYSEEPIDLARFAALGDEGVLCLFGDSTNIERSGSTGSEGDLADSLQDLIGDAPGRVIVTMFASNLHRVQALMDIAHECHRRVLLLGRSLIQNVDIGRSIGVLSLPSDDLIIGRDDLKDFRHDEVVVLTTGSQGEPRSALTRIAMDNHNWFHILPGDYVIFSSRVIPGRERSVGKIVNHLYRRGARVLQQGEFDVHVSGHACREEQKLLINLVRPDVMVPVHGEYHHLARHAAMAEDLGVDQTIIIENGQVITFWDDGTIQQELKVHSGRVVVAGKGVDDSPSVAIGDRVRMARSGMVIAWIIVDCSTGEIVSGPKLFSHGTMSPDNEANLVKLATEESLRALDTLNPEARREPEEVGETLRRAVRRVFNRHTEQKPVVIPIVHEL